jgi:hypothetical protein
MYNPIGEPLIHIEDEPMEAEASEKSYEDEEEFCLICDDLLRFHSFDFNLDNQALMPKEGI